MARTDGSNTNAETILGFSNITYCPRVLLVKVLFIDSGHDQHESLYVVLIEVDIEWNEAVSFILAARTSSFCRRTLAARQYAIY